MLRRSIQWEPHLRVRIVRWTERLDEAKRRFSVCYERVWNVPESFYAVEVVVMSKCGRCRGRKMYIATYWELKAGRPFRRQSLYYYSTMCFEHRCGCRNWRRRIRTKRFRIPSFAGVRVLIIGRSVYVTLSFVLDCYLMLDQSDSTVSIIRKLKVRIAFRDNHPSQLKSSSYSTERQQNTDKWEKEENTKRILCNNFMFVISITTVLCY